MKKYLKKIISLILTFNIVFAYSFACGVYADGENEENNEEPQQTMSQVITYGTVITGYLDDNFTIDTSTKMNISIGIYADEDLTGYNKGQLVKTVNSFSDFSLEESGKYILNIETQDNPYFKQNTKKSIVYDKTNPTNYVFNTTKLPFKNITISKNTNIERPIKYEIKNLQDIKNYEGNTIIPKGMYVKEYVSTGNDIKIELPLKNIYNGEFSIQQTEVPEGYFCDEKVEKTLDDLDKTFSFAPDYTKVRLSIKDEMGQIITGYKLKIGEAIDTNLQLDNIKNIATVKNGIDFTTNTIYGLKPNYRYLIYSTVCPSGYGNIGAIITTNNNGDILEKEIIAKTNKLNIGCFSDDEENIYVGNCEVNIVDDKGNIFKTVKSKFSNLVVDKIPCDKKYTIEMKKCAKGYVRNQYMNTPYPYYIDNKGYDDEYLEEYARLKGTSKASLLSFLDENYKQHNTLSLWLQKPTAYIDLKLVSAVNRFPLREAEYSLYNSDTDKVVSITTTDDKGACITAPVLIGKYENGKYLTEQSYYIKETKAPEGYVLDETPYAVLFDLPDNDNMTQTHIQATFPNRSIVDEQPVTKLVEIGGKNNEIAQNSIKTGYDSDLIRKKLLLTILIIGATLYWYISSIINIVKSKK